MEEKLEQVRKILEKYGQEELLEYDINYTEELLNQILEIDFEQLNKLYKIAIGTEEKSTEKIEAIDYVDKEKLSQEEKEKLKQIGENIIKNNQYAVVTMAGGQRNKTWT